jgi:hypothetical protein
LSFCFNRRDHPIWTFVNLQFIFSNHAFPLGIPNTRNVKIGKFSREVEREILLPLVSLFSRHPATFAGISFPLEKTVSDKITDSLIDPNRIGSLITHETRAMMAQMLEFAPPPSSPPVRDKATVQNLNTFVSSVPSHLSSIVPSLIELVGRILQELEGNLPRLLSLNPSRREAIAYYLDKLAGITSSSNASTSNPSSVSGLRRWIENPRSVTQNAALKTYLEEVAIIALGQAILLKSWSDRGIRNWSESDLGRLNWALSTTLKPQLPLDREGWHITRPNLYSWYNPSPVIQREMWASLDSWRITDEGPSFLITLLAPIRRAQPEIFDPQGYDPRFFKSLWEHMELFGFCSTPDEGMIKRNKVVFSPTLRDGAMVRTSPPTLAWIGLEASPFQFMLSELMQVWWGPSAPPYWSIGTGLEVHTRDQLALALCSPKPSVVSRIAEMEACDIAIVLEEQIVRAQSRNVNSARFREQVEGLPYFKRLRSAGTSLGDLQACVALNKLRPGGLLWWAREEALSSKDGSEVLNFLLDRAKICFEWDFSELEHSLPMGIALFPKYLYLFQKEPNIESRHSHRPIRHSVHGVLRSHVELSLLLSDIFQSALRPPQPRGHWSILSHPSPTPQRDWLEKWPDPTSHSIIRKLDHLRSVSLPLASFTTIRPTPVPTSSPSTSPAADQSRGNQWSVQLNMRGFWLSCEYDAEGRRLSARPLPRPGQEAQGSGYLVLVPDEGWVSPLSSYLMSDIVKKWLDHHAERRGDRWILNEQVVKWIPIPKSLLRGLGVPGAVENPSQPSFTLPLPGDWEKLATEVSYQPQAIREALQQLPLDESGQHIHASIFIRTARALDYLQSGQNRLFSLVTADGRVRWSELLNILPKGECVAISLHPRIRLSGSLPPHLPIGKIERVKAPIPGILLATESGFTLHIGSDSSVLIHMLWEQLEGLTHPTWNELLQYLRLPRKIELAESTAFDVLRSHGEQMTRLQELRSLLSICQLF